MPCDEKRTISLSMPNLDESIMNEVLAGLLQQIQYNDGKLITRNRNGISEKTVTYIKQQYAKKAVRKAAAKHGWTVRETADDSLELER